MRISLPTFTRYLCILAITFLSNQTFAADYFVDLTNGLDTYDGNRWDHTTGTTGAFKTIDKALAAAAAGTSTNIYVKQGIYVMAATPYVFTNKSFLLQGGFPTAATGTVIAGYAAANLTTMQYSSAINMLAVIPTVTVQHL